MFIWYSMLTLSLDVLQMMNVRVRAYTQSEEHTPLFQRIEPTEIYTRPIFLADGSFGEDIAQYRRIIRSNALT